MVPKRPIEEILEENRDWILAIPGVQLVELDLLNTRGPCLRIEVEHANFEVEERIPREIDGWKLEIVEVGER